MFKIYLHDELDPEATAMLQALYSRSSASVETHMEKVRERGSSKFMQSYYVGYGHASIGDCGTTTLFIEGVSILACKALQDNPLYSGQESSTRYIDFSQQPIVDPVNEDASAAILSQWIQFYERATAPLTNYLKAMHPLREGQRERIWEKAIRARCFDILRGFLPAGVGTQLSWSTNLRQAHDKLKLLSHHPLEEVRHVARTCLGVLTEKYPSSFGHKIYVDQEDYLAQTSLKANYLICDKTDGADLPFSYESTICNEELEANELDVLERRPQKTNLPRYLNQYGYYTCTFELDYGSFRDLQRHRNGLCRIPLLNGTLGFHAWYFRQLPDELRYEAIELVTQQYQAIQHLAAVHQVRPVDLQYYYPLGAKVKCQVVYDLPQMVYVTELRSGSTVHPTLRAITHAMHEALSKEHPRLRLYTDLSEDEWELKRGFQDIVSKSVA